MLQDENVTASVIETGPWECNPPIKITLVSYLVSRLAIGYHPEKDMDISADGSRNESSFQLRTCPLSFYSNTCRNTFLLFGITLTNNHGLIPGYFGFRTSLQKKSSKKA